jgi:hypothetical protein
MRLPHLLLMTLALLLLKSFPTSSLHRYPPRSQFYTMSVLLYSRRKSLDALENNHNPDCEYGQTSSCEHSCRHNIRLRQLLLPAILVLSVLGAILAWRCVHRHYFSNQGFVDLKTRGLLTGYSLNPKVAFGPQFRK